LTSPTPRETPPHRRDFLATSATLAGAGLLLPAVTPLVHAASGDTLKVGLVGCGGRGTGAAVQALKADSNVKLIAMGDAFGDRLQSSLKVLLKDDEIGKKIAVKPESCFVGFDAYKQVIDSGVDVVLLTSPPHFRAAHIKYAVEKGKHIFCEKPVAVDAPGVRSVLQSCREAKKKNLAVVSGLCYRYENSKRETMKRVHEGAVGDIVALHCCYNTAGLWKKARQPDWSDMEWQMRNWLYFTWLSGDHIVEQAIHSLDKMIWAMKDIPPARAIGLGGRQVRTSQDYGHIFDHHSVVYEWPSGVKMFHTCRQQDGTFKDVNDYVMGTLGTADVMRHTITGKHPWKHVKDPNDEMYQNEHNELFASIRAGQPINDGERMCQSTLLAIMGRMATYTGEQITWEKALNSKEDLSPPKYEFGPLPVPPVARPGVTKFF